MRLPGAARPRKLLACGAALLTVGCGGADWVNITSADAESPSATVVYIGLDICHPPQNSIPASDVLESNTEVRVRMSMEHPGGDEDACAARLPIELISPIAERLVVDDRSGKRFVVKFGN